MMSSENTAIVSGFFRREGGGENAVGAGVCGSRSKSCEAHLKDRVVVAEEDERNLRRLANAANEIEDAGQCGAGFQSAFGSPLNCWAVSEGIAKGHAELDDVGAGFGKREDEFQRGVKRGIAGGDIGDDAKFAGGTQVGEAFGDASRIGGF